MTVDLSVIGAHKVKNVHTGESVELKSFWQNQDTLIVFFRRWGCMLCRLWAKELAEISPVLRKHNVRLVGVGVEEDGSKIFVDGRFFDGEDLYYVEDRSSYQALGFKKFNVVSIIASLFWKQSREAIYKGKSMGLQSDLIGDGSQNGGALVVKRGGYLKQHFVQVGPADHMPNVDIIEVILCLGGDLKGDWGQTGGALLVGKDGKLLAHFVQTGPGDHMPNLDVLKHFGLEAEYKPETMANQKRDEVVCTPENKS